MNTLVFAAGQIEARLLSPPRRSGISDKQLLCRTIQAEISAADRAILAGAVDLATIAASPISQGGFVLGRLSVAEVIGRGSAAKALPVGTRLYTVDRRPLHGHGFARPEIMVKDECAWPMPEIRADYDGPDPRRAASFLSVAEVLFEAHLAGVDASSQHFGFPADPSAPMLFLPGGGRRGEDVAVPSRSMRWTCDHALLVGHGPELLFLAGLISTLPTGKDDRSKVQVTAVLDRPGDQARQLLEVAGVRVCVAEGAAQVAPVIPDGAFDAVHLVNFLDAQGAAAAHARLKEHGFFAVSTALSSQGVPGFAGLKAVKEKPFVELTGATRFAGQGASVVGVLDRGLPGWFDRLPVLEYAASSMDGAEIARVVREDPWTRVCVKY